MKKLLLLLTCAIVLSTAAPVAAFPRHKSQDTATAHKSRWSWFHRNKQPREKHDKGGNHDPLHNFPKSVGWWHHGPGPAGAGAK